MSTQNNFSRSFQANAAMSRGRVVRVSANGYLDLAVVDAAAHVGVLQEDITSSAYENANVRLWGSGTCMIAVTGVPLTAGNVMVVCTNGYVSVTNGLAGNSGVKVGVLLENAATNGELKEVAFQG